MLKLGQQAATAASNTALVRVWLLIYNCLEDNFRPNMFSGLVIWMPAHGAVHTIGCARKSNSDAIRGIDWRANHLVDGLAKLAAFGVRVPIEAVSVINAGSTAAEFTACQVGCTTHAADNHKH